MHRLQYFIFIFAFFALLSCKKDVVAPSQSNGSEDTYRYLALGDSYTIGESVQADERFPAQLAEDLEDRGYNMAAPKVIATTGWTAGNLLNALDDEQPDNDYDLVTLLIGVNNQYQGRSLEEYKQQYTELLEMAVDYAKGNKDRVVVVSIPDYGYTPFGSARQEQISKELDEFNAAKKEITKAMNIRYVNITPISRRGLDEPDLVASDGLHPSATQYAEWVELIAPEAEEVLNLDE